MDATEDELNHSFDSSASLNQLSLTDSTCSLPAEKVRAASVQPDDFAFELTSITPTKDNRTPVKNEDFSLGNVFVGFKNGWGQKEIKINESKLKKAKKFFDDTQPDEEPECFTVGFGGPSAAIFPPNEPEDYSMPCFKTMGSGAEVKISQQAKQKATSLFREFQSIKKPTKMKKAAKITTESMIKTSNVESKFKVQGQYSFNANRKSFNWEEYQKEYRNQIEKQINKESKKAKRTTEPKRKWNSFTVNRQYLFVKLHTLMISHAQEVKSSLALAVQVRTIPTRTYSHNCSKCGILRCIFCKINFNKQNFGEEDIYKVLNKQFAKKWVNYEQFHFLYQEVCFKLLKYQTYWPDIINKICHVSNIVIEINKKLLQAEKESETSFLSHCIAKDQVGKRINLIVQDICFNQKLNIVFVKLSDGWSSIWAAIEQKNLLFNYARENKKLRVGTKLALALWSLHPISNILDFCPLAKNKQGKCIQFFYNGSIILHPNAKLGHINDEFYRPLNKCKAKGGLIPVTEGIIVRLFSIKSNSKKGRYDNSYNLNNHYAELLTPEGFICLVKFSLNEQSSLVQYFRLYHTYRIYKLKINQENTLSFLMNQSRFEEIKAGKVSQKEQIYPDPICQLLAKRLFNLKNRDEWQDGYYDVLCKNGKIVMLSGKEYDFELEGETNNFSSLYQQVKVQRITDNLIKILKVKESSQLRKFPKIYDKLMSQ